LYHWQGGESTPQKTFTAKGATPKNDWGQASAKKSKKKTKWKLR